MSPTSKKDETGSLLVAPPLASTERRARLQIVHPPALAASLVLGSEPITIGRTGDRGGEVAIPHTTISRRHVSVAWQRGRHIVTELGSKNGSWLDGEVLHEAALADGAVLRLGDVLCVFESGPGLAVEAREEVDRDAVPGLSAASRLLRDALARTANDARPVLLLGETGTGKERAAREVHRLSARKGEYLAVNCAALSRDLIEAELFGHVKGAFTGAQGERPGLFRAAHRGTLLLDEIGDLPLELQAKLLRAIQEGEILPVGSSQPIAVEVRVIGATHRDLGAAVAAGTFRQDLHARLQHWEVRVPPLRERRADLFEWIARLATTLGVATPELHPDAAELLLQYDWPTNLRGVERLVHDLATRDLPAGPIPVPALPRWIDEAVDEAATPAARSSGGTEARVRAPTEAEFKEAFTELAGNVSGLARRFGRDRRQIYRWIEAFGCRK